MKIGITNVNGRMGKALINTAKEDESITISVGFSNKETTKTIFRTTTNIESLALDSDVIIDFSNPKLLLQLLKEQVLIQKSIPLVIGTTGISETEHRKIEKLSQYIPIVQDYNMSIGINLICSTLPYFLETLKDFDVDITDKHHKYKTDSPSGTTKKILDIINSYGKNTIYNETFPDKQRPRDSVGINVIRAGNIFGQHDISFVSKHETININHTALDRELFAEGAIKAAKWLRDKSPGLYSMKDVLGLG
ncbi:MAG: 4-hydroxy-tetrahydrodipicolinate reductase [Rickettsiales bacterium]